MREAVDRRVACDEAVDHSCEQIRARSRELLLIEIDLHGSATRRRKPVIGEHHREVRCDLHVGERANLVFQVVVVGEIVEPQNLLQGAATVLSERQIIQRQV